MPAVIAIFVLAALAPIAAAGPQPPSQAARVVAEREASLKKKIAAAPADPQAYLDLARLQRDFGADADAEATLLKARQALPTNKDVLVQLAFLYSLKQFDKAIETLSICARLDPADPERQYFIATFYQDKIYRDKSLGPVQRATYIREGIAAADRALAIKPDYMEVFVFKGILLKARAELATDPAEKSRTMSEAEAQLNRGRELRAKHATTPDPPSSSTPAPSSTTGHPTTFAPPPPLPPPPSEPSSAVRVGGGIKPPVRTKNVPPVYPAEAAASRTQGMVIIEATIDADGRVADAKVVRSVPSLDQAALDAVRQWEYEPTYVKGQAVPVIMTVTVNFALQ